MYNMFYVLVGCIATAIITLVVTPLVRRLAFIVGAVDNPDKRRVNTKVMPSIGGLAIYLAFFISLFFIQRFESPLILPLFFASSIIVCTGLIDDIKEISPKSKILGIMIASLIIYLSLIHI